MREMGKFLEVFSNTSSLSCSQNASTFDFGIKLNKLLTYQWICWQSNYNLSPVLDIQIDSFFGQQFVPDVQTATAVSRTNTSWDKHCQTQFESHLKLIESKLK